MSLNTLIILPSVLKERSGLHSNVDDKLIYPEIKAVQDMYIMPLMGSTLFNKIIADISGGSLSGQYKTLVDEYIIDAVCNYVMAELAPTLNSQYWNKGVAAKTTENSNTLSGTELKSVTDKYKGRAEHYAQRARRYLQQNAINLFPEFYTIVAGIDVVIPQNTAFDCPIWTGGKEVFIKPNPSFNDPQQYNR
jgi:hypothetical protein